jgi:hypothetical protein
MGSCQYRFSATEIYQRTKPGMGVETHCGGLTFPALDEPEMVPVTVKDPDGGVRTEYRHTGEFLPRGKDDPHCPAHGGTPEPPPRVLTWHELKAGAEELEGQRRAYVAELERAGVPIPGALTAAAALEPAPIHEGAE